MIVAIERNAFNYLYKYDEVKVAITNVIDITSDTYQSKNNDKYVDQFNRALPIFEEDHEVLFLEVQKSQIEFDSSLVIRYKSVKKVIPLTAIGKRMLDGKLNPNIPISDPVFESLIEDIKIRRSLAYRRLAVRKLHQVFKLNNLNPLISKDDYSLIASAVGNILKTGHLQSSNYIQELLAYNLTPNYIPDGNIEFLLKIGMVALRSMGKEEVTIKNGDYYLQSMNLYREVNNGSLAESLYRFLNIDHSGFRNSLKLIDQHINKGSKDIDLFIVSYYFIAFKNYLNKHDYDILGLRHEINTLITQDKVIASWVLTLLGHSFSIERLYESLHKLELNQFSDKFEPSQKTEVITIKESQISKKTDNLPDKSSDIPKSYEKVDLVAKKGTKKNTVTDPSIPSIPDGDEKLKISEDIRDFPPYSPEELQKMKKALIKIQNETNVNHPENQYEGIDEFPDQASLEHQPSDDLKVSELLIEIGRSSLNKKTIKKLSTLIAKNYSGSLKLSKRDFFEFAYLHKDDFDTEVLKVLTKSFPM